MTAVLLGSRQGWLNTAVLVVCAKMLEVLERNDVLPAAMAPFAI